MALPKHLDTAADQLQRASDRLRELRHQAATPGDLRPWLDALTDHALALADVQQFALESTHEELQALSKKVAPR